MDDETPPNFYIGGLQGLHRSADDMATWSPIYIGTPGLPQPMVSQIFIDPDQSARIYLRSTDGDVSGVLRSDDRGETWMSIEQGLPEGAEIHRLFPVLSNPSRFYAYLTDGNTKAVYKTTNRGDTWSLQATLPADTRNMDIHLAMPTLWYYVTRGTVHRSMDEGQTWSNLPTPPIEFEPNLNGLFFIRSDPQVTNNVYVGQSGPFTNVNAAYRSTSQGSGWTKIADGNHSDAHFDDYSTLMYIEESNFANAIVSRNRGVTFDRPPNVPGLSEVEGGPVDLLVDRRNLSTVYTEPYGRGLFVSTDTANSWEPLVSMYSPTIGAQSPPPEYTVSTLDLSSFSVSVEIIAVEDNELAVDFTVASPSQPWLIPTVNSATTPFDLEITIDPSGLAAGIHNGTVTIESAASANGSFDIPVSVNVAETLPPGSVPTILTLAGGSSFRDVEEDIPAIEAYFRTVQDVAVGPDGSLYISDRFDNRIRRKSPNPLLSTVAGNGVSGFAGDGGPAVDAQLDFPSDLAVAPDGTVYVVDDFSRRVRQVTPQGTISTFAGNGEFGTPANAGIGVEQPIPPDSVAVDGSGTVFVGSRSRVLRFVGGGYTTLANVGTTPEGLAVDGAGNIYVAEVSKHRVRKVLPNRTVEDFAGTGDAGFAGDGGPATAAMLNAPQAVAADTAGNVYIADTGNNVIRKVDAAGNISTYVGTGLAGFRGDGGPAAQAQLDEPTGVAVDQDGVLYIADHGNDRVRAVTPTGVLLAQIARDGIVNAASFVSGAISPGSIISMFGLFLAEEDDIAKGAGLPFELGGSTVEIVDSTGTPRPAGIFGIFRDQAQMNLYVDPDTALGPALVRLTTENGQVTVASIDVTAAAPGVFFVPNGQAQNVALAQYLRVSGGQVGPLTLTFNAADFSLTPIDLGPEGDQIFVVLYGTGIRGAGAVTATINGQEVPVAGFAPAPGFFGLDQANIGPIPRSLIGAGPVEIELSTDGEEANVVMVSFQ